MARTNPPALHARQRGSAFHPPSPRDSDADTQVDHAGERPALVVTLLTLLGAALRLANLGGKSFWLDEAFSVVLARAPWAAFVRELRSSEANMGLYYVALRLWLHLGQSEATVRLLSALAGIATIPVIYVVGTRLFDRRAGGAAALILALDPMHVALSQDARSYPIAILLVTCSMWAFTHVVEDRTVTLGGADSRPRRALARRAWDAAYVIASAGAVYAHFYAALVLAAQYVAIVGRAGARPPYRRLLACAAATTALLLPLILFLLRGHHGNIDWLTTEIPYSLSHPRQTLRAPMALVAAAYAALIITLAWAGHRIIPRRRRVGDESSYLLVGLWLAAPIVLPLVVSVILRPVFDPRYAAVGIPALALLAGAVMSELPAQRLMATTLAVVLALELAGDWVYFGRVRKEDWRDATHTVLAAAQPGDVVLFYAPYVRRPYDYYVARAHMAPSSAARGGQPDRVPQALYPPASYSTFGPGDGVDLSLTAAIGRAVGTAPRTWLVLGHARTEPACLRALDQALRTVYLVADDRAFPGVDVWLYRGRAPDAAQNSPSGAFQSAEASIERLCAQR